MGAPPTICSGEEQTGFHPHLFVSARLEATLHNSAIPT